MLGELIKYYNYDWPQLAMWRICCDRVKPDLDLVSLVPSVCMFVLVCLFTSTSVWDGVTDRESVTDQIINVSLELIQFVLSADLSNQTLGFGHRVPKKKKKQTSTLLSLTSGHTQSTQLKDVWSPTTKQIKEGERSKVNWLTKVKPANRGISGSYLSGLYLW